MKIFISNLHRSASAKSLCDLFTPYGEVASSSILVDAYTGRSRGAGHVEMHDEAAGERAVEALHNSAFMRQSLVVREVAGNTFRVRQ